jgi:hypothetical protein
LVLLGSSINKPLQRKNAQEIKMRTLKRLCVATALTLALSFTAFGGSIDTPGITSQPPAQKSSVTVETDTTGLLDSGTTDDDAAAMDSVTGIALFLFDSMMTSVF